MEKLLSIDDVAAVIGVKKSTIYQWTSRGLIPVIRFSARCVKFSEAAVQKWLVEKSCPVASQVEPEPEEKAKKKKSTATVKNISGARVQSIVDRAKKEVLEK